MPPAITEVVQVLKIGSDPRDNLPQAHSAFIDDFAFVQIVVLVGDAIDATADHKLVEVIIFPAHDDLQDPVQLSQGRILPDREAPPDRRLNVPQRHLELIQDTVPFLSRRDAFPAFNMRRTEVRPICNRRAISALLTLARYSFRIWSAFRAAVRGRPRRLPFCRAWASPARTRSRRISRSNSAKTASSPAIARPAGAVRSSASVSHTKRCFGPARGMAKNPRRFCFMKGRFSAIFA